MVHSLFLFPSNSLSAVISHTLKGLSKNLREELAPLYEYFNLVYFQTLQRMSESRYRHAIQILGGLHRRMKVGKSNDTQGPITEEESIVKVTSSKADDSPHIPSAHTPTVTTTYSPSSPYVYSNQLSTAVNRGSLEKYLFCSASPLRATNES